MSAAEEHNAHMVAAAATLSISSAASIPMGTSIEHIDAYVDAMRSLSPSSP